MSHKSSSPNSAHNIALFRPRGRHRGITIVYMAIGMAVLMGGAAISIDYGVLQVKRAQVQEAADSAALAGAWNLAHYTGSVAAEQAARDYAALPENGGYLQGDAKGSKVKITYPATDEKGVLRNNWFRVDISRPEPTFFAAFFGRKSVVVGTSATALYETLADFSIKGKGDYGVAPGPTNLSLFGPQGLYANGDCYSTKRVSYNGAANPLNTNWTGYDFSIEVPKTTTFDSTTLEIFDPDCFNAGGYTDANYNASNINDPNNRIDEYRNASGAASTTASDRTTTKYTLYYDNNTPANPNDDEIVGSSVSYGGQSPTDIAADMKWNSAFTFNRNSTDYKDGQFRLNVLSTAGASENGFDLRVGKTRASSSEAFNPNNGTSIKAVGHLPINFNQGGTTKIALGTLPIEAAGGTLSITKFDTDVNDGSLIDYTCSTLPGVVFPKGALSGQGAFATDTLNVPKTYTTPGVWYAEYKANVQDTSVWDMSYSNAGPGKPGGIKLIR